MVDRVDVEGAGCAKGGFDVIEASRGRVEKDFAAVLKGMTAFADGSNNSNR